MFPAIVKRRICNLPKSNFIYNKQYRSYGTRTEFDSPFDHLPQRAHKSFWSWKTTSFFFVAGGLLAYNETVYDIYESITDTSGEDKLSNLQLEYKLKNLPIYEKLAYSKEGERWVQLKSWENLDQNILDKKLPYKIKSEAEYKEATLTNQTLAQKGGIAIEPVIFHNLDTDEGVTIIHVGYRLCGYPFLVHGGILATLLNETFKRNASLSTKTTSRVKGDFKVENITIAYKYPSFANQFLILKTKPIKSEENNNKNINLQCMIESENGKILVKSEALLIDTGRELNKSSSGRSRLWTLFK